MAVERPSHRYSQVWNNSDVIFIIDDEKFHCHYSILMFNSPVLGAMFKDDFKAENGKIITLPGKEREAFIVVLDLTYPLLPEYEFTTGNRIIF